MKTILVPTDFSECANGALGYAALIAKKSGAKIILLHVIEAPLGTASFPSAGSWAGNHDGSRVPYMMKLMKGVKSKMHKTKFRLSEVSVQDVIETGTAYDAILAAAEKYGVDMIVMGTHGASGMKELLVGSNAERVVRDAEVPVLTIRSAKRKPKIESIVFATDFSEETTLVFPLISDFAEIFKAKIHLVKIVPGSVEQKEAEGEGKRFLKEIPDEKYPVHILHHVTKEEGIRRFAEFIKADMVALGTHGRHGLARFFSGSVAEGMVNHLSFPILTINFHKNIPERAARKAKRHKPESMTPTVPHIPSL